MKTSQRFKNDVERYGPEEAWHKLVYYLITHYGLFVVLRHIRLIDASTNAIVDEVEAVTP